MALLARREIHTDVVSYLEANSDVTTAQDQVLGGDIQVTKELHLRGFGWRRAFGPNAASVREFGIWNSQGVLLKAVIVPSGWQFVQFSDVLVMQPGHTYTIGMMARTDDVRSATGTRTITTTGGTTNILWSVGKFSNSSTLTIPTTVTGDGTFPGDHSLTFWEVSFEDKEEPPEPDFVPAGRSFAISLPTAWFPEKTPIKEWALQYQVGTDDTHFSDWKHVTTLTAGERTTTHEPPEALDPAKYYRYRYKVTSVDNRETNWSEAALAGLRRNSVTPDEDLEEPIDYDDLDEDLQDAIDNIDNTPYMESVIVGGSFTAATVIPPFFTSTGTALRIWHRCNEGSGNATIRWNRGNSLEGSEGISFDGTRTSKTINPTWELDEGDTIEVDVTSTSSARGLTVGIVISP